MLLKDYYKTLDITPAASEQDIKRSFRRLVHRFHPDKNAGDAAAAARFREIREAYDILSDPRQREEYNYKRWYNRSLGKQYQEAPLTPQSILLECERLHNYLLSTGNTRVDYDALSYHIRQLLSESNIRLLRQYDTITVNRQVLNKLVDCCVGLPWRYITPIADLLGQVAGEDGLMKQELNKFIALHRQSSRWNSYRVGLVLVITLLLCWLIYTLGK
jgi:hypothetical protein